MLLEKIFNGKNLTFFPLDLAILHEWTLVMYGTARSPYPKAFVQKYNIPKMEEIGGEIIEDEEEEDDEEEEEQEKEKGGVSPGSKQQQQQPSKHKSPPKVGKAPSVGQPSNAGKGGGSKAPEVSDNRIDGTEANSSSSSSSATASASASGIKNGNNNSRIIFGRFFLSMRIALGVLS